MARLIHVDLLYMYMELGTGHICPWLGTQQQSRGQVKIKEEECMQCRKHIRVEVYVDMVSNFSLGFIRFRYGVNQIKIFHLTFSVIHL